MHSAYTLMANTPQVSNECLAVSHLYSTWHWLQDYNYNYYKLIKSFQIPFHLSLSYQVSHYSMHQTFTRIDLKLLGLGLWWCSICVRPCHKHHRMQDLPWFGWSAQTWILDHHSKASVLLGSMAWHHPSMLLIHLHWLNIEFHCIYIWTT